MIFINIISTKTKNKIIIPNEDLRKTSKNPHHKINTDYIFNKSDMKTKNVTVYYIITSRSFVLSSTNIDEIWNENSNNVF